MRNFRFGELEGREKISFSKYGAATLQHTGCYSCPLRCGKIRRVERGPYAGTETKGPQYESAWAFTGPTGCSDLEATLYANHLCCELGLDCISTGNVIGFAYELFEKGILTPTDTGGLILEPGNPEPMIELIEAIARREGLGDVLAEGVSRAAERIGHGAEDLAMHVKGLEMPAYDPRARKTEGMNYALANAGANHCYGYADQEIGNPRPRVVDPVAEEGIGDVIKYNHDHTTALELTGSCMFPAHNLGFVDLNLLGRMLAAVLGVEHFAAADYLWHVGEKVYNLERCFNLREGFSRADDRLPRRMLAEPLRGGPCDGEVFRNPEGVVDEYYAARGWDRNGIPTKATLERLGLLELEPEVAPLRR